MGKKIMKETNIFKVLADQQRREILIMLKDGRLNAGDADKTIENFTKAVERFANMS